MKICFYNVTAAYIHGGLETYCWEAGRALARRGHQVTIVAGNDGDARHDEVSLVQFPFIHEKSWPDFGTRFRRLMERLSFARNSLGHLVSESYDAVIVNKPFDFPILWRARGLGLRAQTVFRSGGKDFYAGDRYFAGAIDHWLSTSRYNALQVQKRYGRKVGVIHNGVDSDEFRPLTRSGEFRRRMGITDNEFTLLSIGRLVGLKGLRVIIESLQQLPGAHFIIAGDGPEQERLAQQARSLGLDRRVHFAGRVAHDVLPVLLADADAFVQPSIGEESFGISLVEAMACGLPVLASRLGGMLEIVADQNDDTQTGELLPPGDVAAWSAAIGRLMSDVPYRHRLGEAGRIRADAHFTWAANALKLEQMLTGQWSPALDGVDGLEALDALDGLDEQNDGEAPDDVGPEKAASTTAVNK